MTGRLSIVGIAWAAFMTLVIGPVIVFDVLAIAHWRTDKVVALITLPLLAAALWAFWREALRPEPAKTIGQSPQQAIEEGRGRSEARRQRRRR